LVRNCKSSILDSAGCKIPLQRAGALPLDQIYINTVTLAGIRFGIELVADIARRAELNDWLTHKIRPGLQHRILEVADDLMFKRRLLVEEGRKAGRTFSNPDLIIAATGTAGLSASRVSLIVRSPISGLFDTNCQKSCLCFALSFIRAHLRRRTSPAELCRPLAAFLPIPTTHSP
jgi:predicted nucleic acid-binding protein